MVSVSDPQPGSPGSLGTPGEGGDHRCVFYPIFESYTKQALRVAHGLAAVCDGELLVIQC